ncbi:MAG: hypothetical protein NW214_08955 [Pseudanabaenaceae cyanobacterium bins.39]|nr:hypothetical protein [Pseudanabaenaceae cyanobacterium bins.39]
MLSTSVIIDTPLTQHGLEWVLGYGDRVNPTYNELSSIFIFCVYLYLSTKM